MYQIVSWEIIFLLISFLLFYRFKFEKKFICRLLNKIVIYLPLTDNDYKQFLSQKKDKSKGISGMIRSCELSEYTAKTTEEKYLEFDLVVLFYLCNLFIIILNEIKQIIFLAVFNEKEENKFNIISSFSFITFVYFIYLMMKKHIFIRGWISRDAKIFYLVTVLSSLGFYLVELYLPFVFKINYDKINEIANDRLNSLIAQLNANIDFGNYHDISSKELLQLFFSALFGLFSGLLFRPTMRTAYFDEFLISTSEKKALTGDNKDLNRMGVIARIKAVINMFIFFLLLDNLFYDPMGYYFENKGTWKKTYLVILCLSFIFELGCGIYCFWYTAFMFHLQNYTEILKFEKEPTQQNLIYNRTYINYMNKQFWEISLFLFYISFAPLLIFVSYYSRGDLLDLIFKGEAEFKRYFFETSLFVILVAFCFSKGVSLNSSIFYTLFKKQFLGSV